MRRRNRSVNGSRRCAGRTQRTVSRCRACQLVFMAAALSSVHQSTSFVHLQSSIGSLLQRVSTADVGSCTKAASSRHTSCARNALGRANGEVHNSDSSGSSSSTVKMSIARGMRPSSSLQHALPKGGCLFAYILISTTCWYLRFECC
jgi:hypothetical protein